MDSAVRYMIAFMENTGIDIITDGEWRRRSYTDVIAQMTDGFVPGDQYDSMYHIAVEPMENHRHFIAEEAKFIKDNTDRQVKVCLPSPFILGQRMWHPEASKKAYPTRRDFVRATVLFLRTELEAVRDAGIDVAQIDEPHLSGFCDPKARQEFDDPDTDLDFLVDCLNQVVQGIEGITVALHICHFNRGRLGWVNEGGYEPIIPALRKLDVDQYTLEFSIPASGDVDVLKGLPEDRGVALGCVDCRSANIDTPEEIAGRVERALQYIPKERILLAPDCGFAPGIRGSIPLDESYVKLKNEVKAAEILRERYG
jgi:5-methyltetrahydropteroyltriglutamate--homocysteine methyltransferase